MPFKDTKEGTTHYENDGCGEPEHNPMQDIKQQLKQKYGNDNTQSIRSMSYEEFDEVISLAVEQEKERVLAMVLKEIDGMYKTPLNEERESVANVHNQALDTLKEKLQAKQ